MQNFSGMVLEKCPRLHLLDGSQGLPRTATLRSLRVAPAHCSAQNQALGPEQISPESHGLDSVEGLYNQAVFSLVPAAFRVEKTD